MRRPRDIAGVSLAAPRSKYEATDPAFGTAVLARAHPTTPLGLGKLYVRPEDGDAVATFDVRSFVRLVVRSYGEVPPAAAWRALIVEHGLLARPDLIRSGAFPAGWGEDLPASWAGELRAALKALHESYTSLVGPTAESRSRAHLECAECRDAHLRTAASTVPAGRRGHSPWFQSVHRPASLPECPHGPLAVRALGALSRAHPELTFELLGWLEPVGAQIEAPASLPERFVLTRPLVAAMLGPWLLGQHVRAMSWYAYEGYRDRAPRRVYRAPRVTTPEASGVSLPPEQRGALALAASAWGLSAPPEALITADAGSEGTPPALDRAAAPSFDVPLALPSQEAEAAPPSSKRPARKTTGRSRAAARKG